MYTTQYDLCLPFTELLCAHGWKIRKRYYCKYAKIAHELLSIDLTCSFYCFKFLKSPCFIVKSPLLMCIVQIFNKSVA